MTRQSSLNPMILLSGVKLAEMIRRREVSSSDVVEAHIRHVEKVNPAINAVVCTRYDEARAEARAADERIAKGRDLPPFFGVPCSIKESFALSGMPFTSGLVARKHMRAERDATGVERLRKAGAIPIGVTNISELCMWMESNNKVYGRTGNPYDPGRIAGGSSGGEGSIIGAGGTPFGLGADIGGSIRLPAFFNGVFGHKPTGGFVDNSGQYPLPAEGALRYVTTGPLARRAEDLAPLLSILAGEVVDPRPVDLASLTVFTIEENDRIGVHEDLKRALREAAKALGARGATVRPARIKDMARATEIWSAMLDAAAGPSFAELLGEGTPIGAWRELGRYVLRRSPYTLPAVALALLEKIPKLMPDQGKKFIALGAALKRELVDLLGQRGVLLYPPYPVTAPRHNRPLLMPIHWMYTAVFNVMELPVTQVPLGLDGRGIPLGVQVAGVHGNDAVTIRVAEALEQDFGGWVPPKLATA